MLIFALLFTQNALQAQKCCVECQTDVKVISDKQVLLEKIELKAGTLTTNINTNLYVSYRSGNTQKFWTNLVIATAGVAVSTQLNKANLSEGKSANGVSPLLPLGVSIATLPSIWKNRPKGIPQAGLWIQHRDTRGKLLETWEQPISSEAKNDAELLTVSIDKPLTAGTLEVYLQNGSKNGVYYWGYGTISKSVKPIFQNPVVSSSMAGCPDGYLPNGQGMCCNPFTGECMIEGGGTPPPPNPTPNPTPPPTGGGCPSGYLPNGNGLCCNPFSGDCVNEGNVPPTTQQIYSGEWRCMAGLVPTDGGNCLNTSNGDIIAPVFVVNPQDPGPFPNECPIGSKEVIVKDDNGNSTKSCIGGIELGQVTVTAPRLNPLIPITPYPTVTYQPVVISRGGGGGTGTGNGGGTGGTGTGRTDPGDRVERQNMPNPIWIYDGKGQVTGPFGPSSSSNDGGKIIFYFGGFPQMGEILNTNLNEVTVVYSKPLANIDGIWILVPNGMHPRIRSKYERIAELCQNTYDGWAAVAQSDADIAAASFQALTLSVGGTGAATSGLVAWVEARYGLEVAKQLGIAVIGYSTLESLGVVDPIKYVTDIVKDATYEKGLRIAQAKFVDCMIQRLTQ